ncbi:hypothetical protein KC19_12G174800 [Ceratodon purpureus]|uniref:DUF7748 domain-containing protein n=1 Tax=Ceratodon purpureus TaxID=3225 RepID=A0A8T0GAM5_CERPU|nr:hypothetical protein KC19_12G174800 [Ceratodon purpureus]
MVFMEMTSSQHLFSLFWCRRLVVMFLKTRIKNASGFTLEISEGSGGVYRKLLQLEPTKTWTITCNVNSTYREYRILRQSSDNNKSTPFTISSDDVIDYSEIEVSDDSWTGKKRESPTGGSNNEENIGLFRRILKKFGF